MTMISKVQFIFYYMVFMFFIVQIGALAGQTIIQNAPNPPIIPASPTALDWILYPILNIVYFFQLMTISTAYTTLGLIAFTPFVIAMFWAILELIRGI